jgi:hypothetical protein
MTIRPKDRKLAELILFISERSEGDPRFGAAKLVKLLFYCDFQAFRMWKNSISGQDYEMTENGPAPRRLEAVRKLLVERRELAVRKTDAFHQACDRSFALRSANLNEFTAEQIDLVSRMIQENREQSAFQVKNIAEEIWGWHKADISETIPIEIAFISRRPPTEKERRRALQDIPRAKAFFAREAEAVLNDA